MNKKRRVTLACSVCGSRNYTVPVSSGTQKERIERMKFCAHCRQHTLHRETK